MELMEIILLAAGVLIFVLSFFIPDGKDRGDGVFAAMAEREIRDMLRSEMESLRGNMDDMAQEAAADALEKTERSLERLSNEKIMAVSEYSDTVLSEIHKNHEEAMFLYDMLNNKHVSLKNTVAEVNRAVKEAEETAASLKEIAASAGKSGEQDAPPVEVLRKDALPEAVTEVLSAENGKDVFPEADGQRANNNEKILTLYRKGKSAVAIAKELGLGIGEVRLVIGLFEKN